MFFIDSFIKVNYYSGFPVFFFSSNQKLMCRGNFTPDPLLEFLLFRCVETSSADKFLRALVLEGGWREGEGKKERKEKERKKERTADVRGMRRNLNKATESPQGSAACACVCPSPHPLPPSPPLSLVGDGEIVHHSIER